MEKLDKLIGLLNEYVKELGIGNYVGWHNEKTVRNSEYIITKKFGFIKWLVDNDKIDRNKIYWLDMGYKIDEIGIGERKNTVDIDLSNKLLMLLAIQDEPIEFLCSILK